MGATTIYIILGASMQFLLYNYSTRFRVLIADNYFLQKKKKKMLIIRTKIINVIKSKMKHISLTIQCMHLPHLYKL